MNQLNHYVQVLFFYYRFYHHHHHHKHDHVHQHSYHNNNNNNMDNVCVMKFEMITRSPDKGTFHKFEHIVT